MPTIASFTVYVTDFPFKKVFKHAAADRDSSNSLILKCTTDSGQVGFGESLPREYVTGETREYCVDRLVADILPRLKGKTFTSIDELVGFLKQCDGKAPPEWLPPELPQTATWAAVDLALLDAFANEQNIPVRLNHNPLPESFRYSAVFSADRGWQAIKSLLLFRMFGFRAVKLKMASARAASLRAARLGRLILGQNCDIRVDANMAWDLAGAEAIMKDLARYGIRSFEQPLAADRLTDMAALAKSTGLEVMADESLNDAASLERLIETGACAAVNVRISKCGGLVAAYNRCQRALAAGLDVQVGCQVGESSLLSAAQLLLIAAVGKVRYGEGCFGLHLLREDPVRPLMQFGYGGMPPRFPEGPGLGVEVDEQLLERYSLEKITV